MSVRRARAPERRTQKERRDATVRKLLDATIDALVERGYAGASVQVICSGAGLSQGALFQHFATREALLVAAADDIARRHLATFRRDFERRRASEDAGTLAARLLRQRCRSRLNLAWYELLVAARASRTLRTALRPAARRMYADIEALANELLPELSAALQGRFAALVDTVVAVFDGETVRRFVLSDPRRDAARLDLVSDLARVAAAGRRPPGRRSRR